MYNYMYMNIHVPMNGPFIFSVSVAVNASQDGPNAQPNILPATKTSMSVFYIPAETMQHVTIYQVHV